MWLCDRGSLTDQNGLHHSLRGVAAYSAGDQVSGRDLCRPRSVRAHQWLLQLLSVHAAMDIHSLEDSTTGSYGQGPESEETYNNASPSGHLAVAPSMKKS